MQAFDYPMLSAIIGCRRPFDLIDRDGQAWSGKRLQDISCEAWYRDSAILPKLYRSQLPLPFRPELRASRDGDFDAIVALGGGSPIDSAKALMIPRQIRWPDTHYRFPRVRSMRQACL